MKKFTWIFGLALLWGGLNAVAQTPKNVGSFEDLQKVAKVFDDARNASSRLAEKNSELATANRAVEAKKDSLTAANNELTKAANDTTLTRTALNTANNTLKSAQSSYNSVERTYNTAKTNLEKAQEKLSALEAALEEAKTKGTEVTRKCGVEEQAKAMTFFNAPYENSLWFKIDGDNLNLIVSVEEKEGFDKLNFNTFVTAYSETIIKAKTYDLGIYSIELLYNVPGKGEKTYTFTLSSGVTNPVPLRVQMRAFLNNFKGVDETVIAVDAAVVAAAQARYDDQEEVVAERQAAFNNAKSDLEDAQGVLDDAQATANTAQTAYNNAKTAVTTAQGKVTTAQGNLAAAQAEVTRIEGEIIAINASVNAVNDYKTLSITSNIAVTDAALTLGDWGSDYTINGNGYVITYPADAEGSLVGTNRGVINNLGVVHGTLSTANAGNIRIAFETSDGTNYDLYDASGTHTEAPMSGDLAYNRARPYFGVTINADGTFGTLDKKTAANTVYKAEWTDARTKNTTTFYTNATATDLSYNPANGKANTFTYVLDNDLNVTAAFTAKNVVVKGICKNAELTDNVAEGDNGYIYIPTAFKAENLSYDRNFLSSTLATVCLPFEVSEATFKAAGVTKTMQFYEVEAATNTYWFKYQDGSMRANEPYILKFDEGFAGGAIFSNLTNINVAATGNIDRFAVAPERPGSGADFLGVFVSTNATQLAQGGYTLYGFGGGKFRPMTISESNKCLPFRTYVRARNTGNAPAEVFNLGELDEDGNVVTDGGETAISKTEAEAFSVKGINGALVITTDKAQRVSVYTLSGSLVKATNVEVGTVTVPVAAGMYIVNGKKVIVK